MSSDFDHQKPAVHSRSRSRSPHRNSPATSNQSTSQRDFNRSSARNNNTANRFDDRRNNRYRSNQSNNYQGNDYRGGGGNDRVDDMVNLYSDRELGLKYRWEKTVHVSNIPYDMRWAALKDLFRTEVGEVMYTEVFERDGKSLGSGSVEFRNVEEAKRAVEKMHQFEYGGRKLNVKMDEEGYRTRRAKYQSLEGRLSNKDEMMHSHHDQLSHQYGNNGGGGGGNNNMSHSHQVAGLNSIGSSLSGYSSVAGIQPYVLQRLGIEGPVSNKVFVANLDFKCDEKKVREVFSLAGRIRDVTLKRNKEGQSRGMAVVEYEHPSEAVQAVSMFNEQQLYDRIMAVKIDLKDEGKDDGRSMKLPSGLKSIGVGLGISGNQLRNTNVNQLEPPMQQQLNQMNPNQMNPNQMNPNPMPTMTPNVSDYMNHSDLTALQALSQLTPSAISALTQLAASGFSGLNSLSGMQQNNPGMNSGSVGVDPYAAANSIYSSLGGGYANYQQTSALANASQLASSLSGQFYKDDDARLGQSAPVGVSSLASGRAQPTSSFAGGRNVLGGGIGVGGISGLGASLGAYGTSNTSAQRSVGGVLGNNGVTGPNTGIYERPRGRSPYR